MAAAAMNRLAYLGLGGNLGDPRQQMAQAIALLGEHDSVVLEAVSALYFTPPWGVLEQPDFLNAAIRVRTSLSAQALLALCLDTEKRLMRERHERWGPRLIDIDILLIEGEYIDEPDLHIPHLRLSERLFALLPLADVAGDPMLGEGRVSECISRLNAEGIRRENDLDWWKQKLKI